MIDKIPTRMVRVIIGLDFKEQWEELVKIKSQPTEIRSPKL
jgi:hypothetical protein